MRHLGYGGEDGRKGGRGKGRQWGTEEQVGVHAKGEVHRGTYGEKRGREVEVKLAGERRENRMTGVERQRERWRNEEKLFYVTACECMFLHVLLLHKIKIKKHSICLCACTRRTRTSVYGVRVLAFSYLCLRACMCVCTLGMPLPLSLSDTCLVCLWGAWPMLKASSVLSTARLNVYTSVRKLHGSDAPLPLSSLWTSSAIRTFLAAMLHQRWCWFICWGGSDLWEWEGREKWLCQHTHHWHCSMAGNAPLW